VEVSGQRATACSERHEQFSLQTVSIDDSRNIEQPCAIGVWEPLNATASLSRIADVGVIQEPDPKARARARA